MKDLLKDLFDKDPASSGGQYSNAFCNTVREALKEPIQQFMDERKKEAVNETLAKQ